MHLSYTDRDCIFRPRTDVRLTRLLASFLALAALLLAADPARAACTDVAFTDGFESGDTSRWANSPVAAPASGSWLFSLDFTGSARKFAVELVERPGGQLVGYLLGGTRYRTLVSGLASGSSVSFQLELTHSTATRTISFNGSLAGNTISGTASGDITNQAVTLERTFCELYEQQFAAAQDTGGPEPEHVTYLSVVLDEENALVAGGFVGEDDCGLWACDGGVTSFSESGDTLIFGLETDGGCSAGSGFTADWDPGGLYIGTFGFTDCSGTNSGDLLAAFGMGTSSRAAREALNGRTEIAEALEGGIPLTEPLAGLSPIFLNFGKIEPALRAELNAEMSLYNGIEVDLRRARELRTSSHPRTFADLLQPFGMTIDEIRSGIPMSGGPTPVRYRDTVSRPIIDDFALLGQEAGVWRIVGNQTPALDLPFAYTIPSGGSRLEAPTAGGSPNYISLGPYGAHFPPLSGDPSGEAKANFVGFLAEDDSDMEELVGNGNGIREPGETWGYPTGGDLSGDRVRLRRPAYIAPLDGTVRWVIYTLDPTGVYFDNEPHWNVGIGFVGGLRLAFGHLGRIAPDLRDLVLAETGIDADTFAGPPGTDLLDGHDPIPVAAGTELALPQIMADPVPGFPGYYVGGGSFLEYPWAQIEFQAPFSLGEGSDLSADFCVYRFLDGSRRGELQTVMDADMLDLDSLRYRDRHFTERWQWSAQGSLCQAESLLPRDFSDLYTNLGGWFERPESGTTADELFSFVPIDKAAAAYDSTQYDSTAVSHLVIRNVWPGPYSWMMPDGTTAMVFLAVGEVLERTADEMLIKWRDFNATNPTVYQRAAYRLDNDGLTIKWGNFAASSGATVPPVLLITDPCDDTSVLCYDHSLGAWPPL
ncbi:MAG: hypothetical protein GWP16_00010 [Nitrospirae bacterium]|nr:hypothetical protein [Nitrospirota bacterium]